MHPFDPQRSGDGRRIQLTSPYEQRLLRRMRRSIDAVITLFAVGCVGWGSAAFAQNAPVAQDDGPFTVDEGGTLAGAPSVLSNDIEFDGDPLTAGLLAGPANAASFNLGANGVISYSHDGSETTSDQFTYEACDDEIPQQCDSATVSFVISPVNDDPVANDDSATVQEDSTNNAIDVTGNDTDPEGDALTVTVATAQNGAASGNGGNVVYTPDTDFSGTDTIDYTISDGNGGSASATVTVTVNPVNDPPIATDDLATVAEDSTFNFINVTSNDSDPDGDTVRVIAANAANGTATPVGNDFVRYTPDPDFSGTDTIDYTITDDNGGTDAGSVTVTVTPSNDAPVANDDVATVAEDSSNNALAVTANDSDVDGDPLTVIAATALNGSATPSGGSVLYTPNADFSGSDTISYTISDGNGGTDTASVAVTVTDTNDPPVAVDDTASVAEDSTDNVLDVTANDTDADGDALTVTAASATSGTAVPDGGTVLYTPAADFSGAVTVSYTVSDGNGGTDDATVSVTVTAENDPPVANDDTATVVEDSTDNVLDVTANDTDVEGDTLTVTEATASVGSALPGGTTVSYSPPADFFGPASISYTVSDGNGGSDTATVSVTVTPVNDPPTANDDSATVAEDSSGNVIDVTANDDDPDGDTLTVTGASASDGTASPSGGTVVFTPDADFAGDVTIDYTISDGNGESASATVRVEVSAENDAPVIEAQAQVLSTAEDSSLTLSLDAVTVTDIDSDADDLSLIVDDGPDYSVNDLTITPSQDFNGDLSVSVRVTDGEDPSQPFILVVTVTPVNDAPAVTGQQPLTTSEDSSLGISLADIGIEDPDDTQFTFVLQDGDDYSVTGATITPDPDFNGQLAVPVIVNDGELDSLPFPLVVSVTAVNDAPELVADITELQAVENNFFESDLSVNFVDVDGDALTFAIDGLPASGNFSIDPQTGVLSGTAVFEDTRDEPYPVTVTAVDDDGTSASDVFDFTVAALNRANVSLDIAAAPAPAMAGDEIRWTFTAQNAGPQGTVGLELTGRYFGAGLAVTPVPPAVCTLTPVDAMQTDFACTLTDIGPDGSTTAELTTGADGAGEIVVSATAAVSGTLPIDPNIDNNSRLFAAGLVERFSNGPVQFLGSADVRSIAVGDVNGDGEADIVLGTAAGMPLELHLSDGFRGFADAFQLADSNANNALALGDLDGDGDLDLVVANGGGIGGRVFDNDGQGALNAAASLPPADTNGVVLADFDADGNLDAAFAASGPNPVYLGDGSGGFTLLTSIGSADSRDVAAADFDGDGLVDLAFANVAGPSTVWLNDNGTGFAARVSTSQPDSAPETAEAVVDTIAGDAVAVVAVDVDNDFDIDLAFARVPGDAEDLPANPVLLNDGSADFTVSESLGLSPTLDILAADIDGDGRMDLVFVNATGAHQVWRGTVAGFALYAEQIALLGASAGALGDLGDADVGQPGGLDLVLGGSAAGGAEVLLNDGLGNLGMGDAVPPILTLVGDAVIDVPSGSAYNDPGASAEDNIDGDISSDIRVDNTVNTAVVGSYTVTYEVSDAAGNPAEPISRTVNVTPAAGAGGGGGGSLAAQSLAALLILLVFWQYRSRIRPALERRRSWPTGDSSHAQSSR